MAADMKIHVVEGITEDDLAVFFSSHLGSKYFQILPSYSNEIWNENHRKIASTPSVWVGEVSWLKQSILDVEDGHYVPDVVGDLFDLIGEDLPTVDDEFVNQVEAIYDRARAHEFYSTSAGSEVVAFLREHKGKKVFTVSW